MTGAEDPTGDVVRAWLGGEHVGEVRREHMREWWPALAEALDALAWVPSVIPEQRRAPGPKLEAALVVACLVRRYGDRHPEQPGVTSAQVSWEDLVNIDAGELTVLTEPSTGAMYIRHKGPALDE